MQNIYFLCYWYIYISLILNVLQLTFIVSVTPPDYEPRGFKAGKNDSLVFSQTPLTFKVGEVHYSLLFNKVKKSVYV